MLFEIIMALVLGILIGTLTGLTPGIHINLVSAYLVFLSAGLLAQVPPNLFSYLYCFNVNNPYFY